VSTPGQNGVKAVILLVLAATEAQLEALKTIPQMKI
jgi:hypothetical protein